MSPRTFLSLLILFLGLLTTAVGVLHFAMMGHLTLLTEDWIQKGKASEIIATVSINHIGSGVFLLILGVILIFFVLPGLRRGKRSALRLCFVIGVGFVGLAIALWSTVPAVFLESTAFQFALASLSMIGVLLLLPLIAFRKYFNEQ